MLKRLLLLSVLPGVAAASACRDVSTDPPRTIQVALTVDETERRVGESFTFRYEGEGRSILGLVLHFGDGRVDSIPGFGAQTASGFREHAFEAEGVFLAVVELEDGSGVVVADSVPLQVLEAGASALP
jgi:hypothetical protein